MHLATVPCIKERSLAKPFSECRQLKINVFKTGNRPREDKLYDFQIGRAQLMNDATSITELTEVE